MRVAVEGPEIVASRRSVQQRKQLVEAAQQFEAMLLQELLKPIQSGKDDWDTTEKDSDHSADTLNGFGTEAVANAIAKNDGVGIARKIIQQVTHESSSKSQNNRWGTKV
jgi:peptidoglycan hydrolase FlgJ